jgi:hypothetical protein
MKEVDVKRRDMSGDLQFDVMGWAGYAAGLVVSLLGYKASGAVIGGLSLALVIGFYLRKPVNDCFALGHRRQEKLNVVLLLSFFVLLLVRFAGIAYLCLGANFFLWGCLGLKTQKIYVGSEWRLEERACYTKTAHPIRYWLWTVLALTLGAILLVAPLWKNMWFLYKDDV